MATILQAKFWNVFSSFFFVFCVKFHCGLLLNTLRSRQKGCHFPDNILKCIFLNENMRHSTSMSYGPIDKKSSLVHVMAWLWTEPTPSHYLNQWWLISLIHVCAIKPWFDHYTVLWTRWLAPLRVVVTLTLQTMVSIFLNKNSEFWSHFCCIFFHTTSAMMVQYWFDHRIDNSISVWPQDRWQAVILNDDSVLSHIYSKVHMYYYNMTHGNKSLLPLFLETRQIWGIWKLRLAYSPETPNLGQNRWCFVPCDLKFDGWHWKTIEHLSFAVSSFVQHFIAIGEFKLELQSGNAHFGSNSTIFRAVWPWNLTDDLEKQ